METPQQIMEYLNYVDADPEGDELKKLLFEWMHFVILNIHFL